MTEEVEPTAEADETDRMISTAIATFSPNDAKIAEVSAFGLALKVQGPTDMDGYNACHRELQEVKRMLGAIDSKHEELKKGVNKYGRAVDAERRRLRGMLEPVRDHLADQKRIVDEYRERLKAEAAAKAEAERKAKLDARMKALLQWRTDLSPSFVESLDDEAFEKCLADSAELARARREKEEQEALERAEREAEAAAERKREQEAAEARERVRLRTLERMQKLSQYGTYENPLVLNEMDEAEFHLVLARAKESFDNAAQAKAAQAERDRAERERLAAERRELEEQRRKFEEDRRAEEQRRAAERRAAEEKRQAEERAAAEKAEAERKAALAPVREKLYKLAADMRALRVPGGEFQTAATAIIADAAGRIEELAQ